MGQKASGSEKKASSKKSQFTVELTRKKLLLGLGVAFLSMAWMFTLGVLVGRDLSPVRFDVKKIKKELIALKQKALKTDQTLSEIEKDKLSNDPELGFYEVLTDKKKEAELKFAKAHKRTAKIEEVSPTAARANQADKKEQIPLKLSAVDKRTAKLDKAPPAAPKEDKMEGQGLLTIQVASLKDVQDAKQMVDRLKRKGYEAYQVTAALGGKGTFHRVRVGHFTDSDKASQVAARLKRENFEIMILRE
ncbi:MAG: SPOR domain-containing protein [Desulfobacterales bacterium]|nr:MAG: SPOR domain-containing protein [Desulfobacterales bacterium]